MSFDERHPPEGNVHYLWTEGEFYDACDRIDEDRGGTTPIEGKVTAISTAKEYEPRVKVKGEFLSFAELEQRNAENKERMEKERSTANKSVLRSYRIRHD